MLRTRHFLHNIKVAPYVLGVPRFSTNTSDNSQAPANVTSVVTSKDAHENANVPSTIENIRADTAVLNGQPPEQAVRNVVIYQPARNAMQSGTYQTRFWKIRFDRQERWENPLMGWTSSADPLQAMNINFSSKEAACAFAEKNGWKYDILFAEKPISIKKAYADNFKYEPRKLRLIRTK